TILLTTSVDIIGGNAAKSQAASQRSRSQSMSTFVTTGCGELQPRKCTFPSEVTTSKRGAPAPQCDPFGVEMLRPPFLMSYPSSVSVMPLTLISSAVAAAKLLVGPVLTSRRPWLRLSFESPPGQAVSIYGAVPPTPVKLAFGVAMNPLVTQPIPLSH